MRLLFALLVLSLAAQAQLPADWRARLLFLEASRSGDVAAWETLWTQTRGDPHAHAQLLRGLGRCAHPELKPLFAKLLKTEEAAWGEDALKAAALSAGLFGDAELVPELLGRAPMRCIALALGLCGRLPEDAKKREALLTAFASEPPLITAKGEDLGLDDAQAALLVYGARLDGAPLQPLAAKALGSDSPARVNAALYHLWRCPKAPPAELVERVFALVSGEGERGGMAAHVAARFPDRKEAAAETIAKAFLATKPDRMAQIGRLRALGRLKQEAGATAVIAAVASKDPQLRRCAWEAAGTWLPEMERAKLHTRYEAEAEPDVRRAALIALGAIDPNYVAASLAWLRLGAPVTLRAAAARALLQRPDPSLEQLRPFLHDPDRRVRTALIEELTNGIDSGRLNSPAARKVASELAFHVLKSLFPALDRTNGTKILPRFFASFGEEAAADGPALFPFCAADPVLMGEGARLLTTLFEKRWLESPPDSDGRPILMAFIRGIPSHEVEAMQQLLKLAKFLPQGASERFLRRLLKAEEYDIRLKARQALIDRGLGTAPWPPRVEGPAVAALKARCAKVAATVEKDPRPKLFIKTTKGELEVELYREDAALTVDAILNLASKGYFDGLLWHRVVPGHVAQAGCPRGDGWGGPGHTIPCEINDRSYGRGTLGMALAGKDTGGSQWFFCHRPRPHLDGRYTIFGQLIRGDEVLSALLPGDLILSIRQHR